MKRIIGFIDKALFSKYGILTDAIVIGLLYLTNVL